MSEADATKSADPADGQRTVENGEAGGSWCVVRLDDNGNRYEIARDLPQGAAQRMVREFEESGHKQCYWAVTQT